MSLLRGEGFPEEGETPRVQDAPAGETAGDKATQRFVIKPSDEVLIESHHTMADFHYRKIEEAERSGMPAWQAEIHETEFQTQMSALDEYGVLEAVPEAAVAEPAVRETHVPALALPQLAV